MHQWLSRAFWYTRHNNRHHQLTSTILCNRVQPLVGTVALLTAVQVSLRILVFVALLCSSHDDMGQVAAVARVSSCLQKYADEKISPPFQKALDKKWVHPSLVQFSIMIVKNDSPLLNNHDVKMYTHIAQQWNGLSRRNVFLVILPAESWSE